MCKATALPMSRLKVQVIT